MKQLLFILFLVYSSFSSAFAQNRYYFSSHTVGKEEGTQMHPYGSLQDLLRLELEPGDSVFFMAGDTLSGSILLDNINGTREHNVVFTSYGRGRCTINGGNKEALVITNSKYFVVSNLILSGNGRKAGNTTDGLKLVNCENIAVENIDISGFQKSGLLLYNCVTAEVNGVFAHENGATGILVEGDYKKRISRNIHIIDCRADDNPGDPSNLKNHSGNGILVGNCKDVLIEYCTATNNGWDMPRIGNGPVGIWAYEADSVIIQYCISYKNKTAKGAADGGGFDLDGGVTNSMIQYCLSYDNWGSGYAVYQYWSASKWNNNTIRYCISINDGNVTEEASAMLIWNGHNGDSTFTDFYAYNNFFYNDKKYAFSFSPLNDHKNFSFFNNVFVASDTSDIYNGTDSSSNDKFLGNVWMRKDGGFMQNGFSDYKKWAKFTGYEQSNGKVTGHSFQKRIFNLPDYIHITDPYLLRTNPILLSLCKKVLHHKGINISKMLLIKKGEKDFFGHSIISGNNTNPGICSDK